MIGFWIAAALLTALVLLVLLRPLMRAGTPSPALDAADQGAQQAVYRDQLDEVARDLERGLLTPDQAQAVRAEVGRRLLSAAVLDRAGGASAAAPPFSTLAPAAGRRWGAALLVLVPLATLALYFKVGSPDLPGQPAASRAARAPAGDEGAAALAALETATREHPDDPAAWARLGAALSAGERYERAAVALRRAVALAPNDAALRGGLAEALTLSGDGIVSPEARDAVTAALALDPLEPRARYYEGLALRQSGDLKGAIARWGSFLAASPADAPWVPFLRGQIGAAAAEAGIDPASVMTNPAPAANPAATIAPTIAPGPSADQVTAAAGMGAQDRAQMIQGMVDRLAARLQAEPRDPEGWRRLAQAYRVLGRADDAAAADANAQRYAGQTADAATSTPDEALRRQVAQMTPEQRLAKIDSLLTDLAAKAQANPGDAQAWARLAQAYGVTGRAAQAKAAWARARTAAPDDDGVALAYARSLLPDDARTAPPAEFYAVLRGVLAHQPDNPQALWYLGEQAAGSGKPGEARALWGRLLKAMPADSPDRAELEQRIAALPAR